MSGISNSKSNRASYSASSSSSNTPKSKVGFKNNVRRMCYSVFRPRTKVDRLLFALAC